MIFSVIGSNLFSSVFIGAPSVAKFSRGSEPLDKLRHSVCTVEGLIPMKKCLIRSCDAQRSPALPTCLPIMAVHFTKARHRLRPKDVPLAIRQGAPEPVEGTASPR